MFVRGDIVRLRHDYSGYDYTSQPYSDVSYLVTGVGSGVVSLEGLPDIGIVTDELPQIRERHRMFNVFMEEHFVLERDYKKSSTRKSHLPAWI